MKTSKVVVKQEHFIVVVQHAKTCRVLQRTLFVMQVTSQCVSLDKWDFGAVKQTLFSVLAYRCSSLHCSDGYTIIRGPQSDLHHVARQLLGRYHCLDKAQLGRCYEKNPQLLGKESTSKLILEYLLHDSLHSSSNSISERSMGQESADSWKRSSHSTSSQEGGGRLLWGTSGCGGPAGTPGTKLSWPEPPHSAPCSSCLLRAPLLPV